MRVVFEYFVFSGGENIPHRSGHLLIVETRDITQIINVGQFLLIQIAGAQEQDFFVAVNNSHPARQDSQNIAPAFQAFPGNMHIECGSADHQKNNAKAR